MPTMTWPDIDGVDVTPYYPYGPMRFGPGPQADGARSMLQNGDVLVCYGETRGWAKAAHPVQWRIQRRSGYLAIHVGLIWKTDRRAMVIEALGGDTVRVSALSRQIPGLDDGKFHVAKQPNHMFVMRPDYPVTGAWTNEIARIDNANGAIDYALDQEGADYTEWGIVRLALAKALGYTIQPSRLMFCSRLVAEALRFASVPVPRTFAGYSSPGDVAGVCDLVCCLWHPEK